MRRFEQELGDRLKSFSAAPFLFVGAGMSRRYLGLDDWSGVLRRLAALTSQPYEYFAATADNDLPTVASRIARELHEPWWREPRFAPSRDKYRKQLHTRESAAKAELARYVANAGARDLPTTGPLGDELEAFRHVVVDGVITTNFDFLLERLFPDFRVYVGQEELLFDSPVGVGEIYKIHGSCEAPDSIVLTRRDYDRFDRNNPYLAAKLLTTFVEHPIIFLGYSLTDANIAGMLQALVSCLKSAERIAKLAERLIFVEWDSTVGGPLMAPAVIPAGRRPLPVLSVRTPEFQPLFEVLARQERRFPAKLLRQLKEHVYELILENDPGGRLHVQALDPDQDPREVDIVLGIGRFDAGIPVAGVEAPHGLAVESVREDVDVVDPPDADSDAPAALGTHTEDAQETTSPVVDTRYTYRPRPLGDEPERRAFSGLIDWETARWDRTTLRVRLSAAARHGDGSAQWHDELAKHIVAVARADENLPNRDTVPSQPEVSYSTGFGDEEGLVAWIARWRITIDEVRQLLEGIVADAWLAAEREMSATKGAERHRDGDAERRRWFWRKRPDRPVPLAIESQPETAERGTVLRGWNDFGMRVTALAAKRNTEALQSLHGVLTAIASSNRFGESENAYKMCAAFMSGFTRSVRAHGGAKQHSVPFRSPWREIADPAWTDHAYLYEFADGRVHLVSEPYQLRRRELEALLSIPPDWGVYLDGRSVHYPGRTFAVHVTPPHD